MTDRSSHEAANARKWSKRAETYDKKRFDYFRWMQRRALSFLDLSPGIHFLDVGCGTGFAVRHAAEALEGQGVFCGVDIAEGMIETARNASRGLEGVRFAVATAEELPFADGYFDCLVCTNSFHHYLNPSKALAEMRRVLRAGGRAVILDVTADNPLLAWIDRRVRRKEPEHVKFYSMSEYRDMFAQASLTHLVTRTILPPLKVHFAVKPR